MVTFGFQNEPCSVVREDGSEMEQTIYFVCSTLSVLGSLAIVLSCTFIKELRKTPYSLVAFLSLCDFCFSMKFLLSSLELDIATKENACVYEAAWTQFWGLGSVSWNGVIALNVLLMFRKALNQFSYDLYYHIYVWGMCVLTTVLLIVTNTYGISLDGTSCWICKSDKFAQLLFFGPLMLYFLISLVTLSYAIFRVKFILRKKRGEKRILLRMLLFIFVFLAVWVAPCIHIIITVTGNEIEWMTYTDALSIGLQGFANAIVWLTSPYFLFQIQKSTLCMKLSVCYGSGSDEERTESSSIMQDLNEVNERMRLHSISGFVSGIHAYINGEYNQQLVKNMPKRPPRFYSEDYEEEIDIVNFSLPANAMETPILDFQNMTMKVYAPKIFKCLRQFFDISDELLLQSLDINNILKHARSQKFSEGRSGSIMILLPNSPIIIKLLYTSEAILFRKLIQKYYLHMLSMEEDDNNLMTSRDGSYARTSASLLNRFFGFFSITTPYLSETSYCVIINNIFYNSLPIHRRYDLKGSWVRRSVGEKHKKDEKVLGMDSDFNEMFQNLQIAGPLRNQFIRSIKSDTKFLHKCGILDYSLLIGIHIINYHSDSQTHISINENANMMDLRKSGNNINLLDNDNTNDDDNNNNNNLRSSGNQFRSSSSNELIRLSNTDLGNEEELEGNSDYYQYFSNSNILGSQRSYYEGGIVSSDRKYIYYMGIIDMLQLYDCNKMSEYCLKVYLQRKDRKGVSVQPPAKYAKRFVDYIESITK